jgi:uncharacterized membrane protein
MVEYTNAAAIDSILIGAATGGRTTAGLAALAVTGVPHAAVTAPKPLWWLQKRWSKPVQLAALVGELIVDKLPSTPSRLHAGSLGLRTATGAAAATALAQRNSSDVASAALLGGFGALAGSVLGARWRRRAARRGVADLVPALIEDAVTVAIALYACRPRSAPATIDLTTQPPTVHRRDHTAGGFIAHPQVN